MAVFKEKLILKSSIEEIEFTQRKKSGLKPEYRPKGEEDETDGNDDEEEEENLAVIPKKLRGKDNSTFALDHKKRMKIACVEEGWNLNDYFFTQNAIKQLPDLMMQKPKIFVDHSMWAFLGRSNKDWMATINKCWSGTDSKDNKMKVFADITFTNNPATAWMFEAAKENPEDLQFSIHIEAPTVEFKDDSQNRVGRKIDSISKYYSCDGVTYGAAGGKALQIYNSVLEEELQSTHNNVINPQKPKEEETQMDIKNAEDLRKAFPEFVEQIQNSAIQSANTSKEIDSLKTKNEELTNSVNSLTSEKEASNKKVEELTNSIKTLSDENTKLKAEVDEFKTKETVAGWQKQVNDEIVNSKIDDKLVSKAFRELLFGLNDIEKVKSLIEDRKSLVPSSVIQNGGPAGQKKDGSDEAKFDVNNDDEIVAAFKARR
jgi:hypothetical protein